MKTIKSCLLLVIFINVATAQTTSNSNGQNLHNIPKESSVAAENLVIPSSIVGKKIMIEAKINDKGPFKFILDTGASANVFNQDLADELNLPVVGTTKIGDPSNPQGIDANQNHIKKLEIGGATFSDFMAISWKRTLEIEGNPRGILGLPLFNKLLLTIDYPKNQVIITQGSLPQANGADIFDFQPGFRLLGIPIKVAETNFNATIDTGAPMGISFPDSFMEKLPLAEKPTAIAQGMTVNGTSVVHSAKLNGKIIIGKYEFENTNVSFFGRLRQVNLGFEFLQSFILTIDQQNKRVKLERVTKQ